MSITCRITFPVGAGLPAMAVGQSPQMLQVTASSLASQLPQGFALI
ncbi:hypothetical protein [Pseudomonas fluorescens]|nr:hypothetical protein [Pseudomonas fluorescens]